MQKYASLRTRAESVAASLRHSEQQRVRLASKYASVGTKVEALMRAEEDFSAQTASRLSNELEATQKLLSEQKRAHENEVKELSQRLEASLQVGWMSILSRCLILCRIALFCYHCVRVCLFVFVS